MQLFGLNFQKYEKIKEATIPLTSQLNYEDLPPTLQDLLASGGGYLEHPFYPSDEPTSDALEGLFIPYLAGLNAISPKMPFEIPSLNAQEHFRLRPYLPKTSVILYEDQARAVFIDMALDGAIRYLDYETDQWLTLATQATDFLNHFTSKPRLVPQAPMATYHRYNWAFLYNQNAQNLAHLLSEVEVGYDKQWLFYWLDYFYRHPQAPYQKIAQEAVLWQLSYFKRDLPNSPEQIMVQFDITEI